MINPDNDRRDPEFRATIAAAYHDLLGRDPDPTGLEGWLHYVRVPPDGLGKTGDELRAAIAETPEAVAYRNQPPTVAPPSPAEAITALVPGGVWLAPPGWPGRFVVRGTDQFRALRMALDGADLQPLIDESRTLGVNTWRVFGAGSVAQNGLLDLRPRTEPRFYDVLRDLAHRLNDNGIVLLHTCYADNQDVQSGLDVWQRTGGALAGTASLLSGFNQWSKNIDDERGRPSNFDPSALTPAPVPWSRGSDVGDVHPYAPTGSTFMEFHPRRDYPASLMDAVASPCDLYLVEKYPMIPLLITEPPRMGTDGSGPEYADPTICWRFGRLYSTMLAGAVFHSRSGQTGTVMDAGTRPCAEAFFDGLRL
jgi:hypothetical protein